MLLKKYKQKIAAEGWNEDQEQLEAVAILNRLLKEIINQNKKSFWLFSKKETVKGAYLFGGVGRGKSMLMDMFYEALPDKTLKQRIHFHEFMIKTHDWMHEKRGDRVDDLLPRYAKYVAQNVKILCFDEFHVTDVTDAMILGRLFKSLFEEGVVVVATSNWAPDNLYEGGLQRDLFIPFIELLKQRMEIVHLDSNKDYRQISAPDQEVYYFYPLNEESKAKANLLFKEFLDGQKAVQDKVSVKGRDIIIRESGNGIAKFTFAELCEQPLGAEDYIAVADKFHTVFLKSIPRLTYDRRNEAKRLILLIDCLYEAGCRFVMTAEKPFNAIYEGHDHVFEFDRTISRLMEMQSKAYHDEAKRIRGA